MNFKDVYILGDCVGVGAYYNSLKNIESENFIYIVDGKNYPLGLWNVDSINYTSNYWEEYLKKSYGKVVLLTDSYLKIDLEDMAVIDGVTSILERASGRTLILGMGKNPPYFIENSKFISMDLVVNLIDDGISRGMLMDQLLNEYLVDFNFDTVIIDHPNLEFILDLIRYRFEMRNPEVKIISKRELIVDEFKEYLVENSNRRKSPTHKFFTTGLMHEFYMPVEKFLHVEKKLHVRNFSEVKTIDKVLNFLDRFENFLKELD